MKTKLFVAALVVAILVLLAFIVGLFFPSLFAPTTQDSTATQSQGQLPTSGPESDDAISQTTTVPVTDEVDIEFAPLPPPLAEVDFPSQPVDYPPDWPSLLIYPEQFVLVDASSGTLPEDTSTNGWAAKLRYQGTVEEAAEQMKSFFEPNGWQVVEQSELDGGGVLLLMAQTEPAGTVIVVLDPDQDNSSETRILATVFQ